MPDFYKYHALGNDYIVIDPKHLDRAMTPDNIRLICDRNFGVGSDGILYGPVIQDGLFRLRIFNPDGGEAEKSGNGVRIFSRYLFDAGYVTEKSFDLYTLGGKVQVEILDEKADLIKVDMGTVTFESSIIPVAGEAREVIGELLMIEEELLTVTCLSIGNPHCVIPMQEISREKAMHLGPLIENHPLFPKRINVQLLKVLSSHSIQLEIWERGAGYTLASGSSSCAAASAAHRLGLTGRDVEVVMPGGTITIQIDDCGHVHMTGTVSPVASGDFLPGFLQRL